MARAAAAFLLTWLCAVSALAVDPPPPEDIEPRLLTLDGHPGQWFPMDFARYLLSVEATAEDSDLIIKLQEKALTECRVGASEFLEANSTATDIIKQSAAISARETARANRAEEKLAAWWRHPATMLATGLVLGGAMVAVGSAAR